MGTRECAGSPRPPAMRRTSGRHATLQYTPQSIPLANLPRLAAPLPTGCTCGRRTGGRGGAPARGSRQLSVSVPDLRLTATDWGRRHTGQTGGCQSGAPGRSKPSSSAGSLGYKLLETRHLSASRPCRETLAGFLLSFRVPAATRRPACPTWSLVAAPAAGRESVTEPGVGRWQPESLARGEDECDEFCGA